MNYHEYQRAKRIKASEKRISKILDSLADSYLRADARKIDAVLNKGLGKGFSKRIPNVKLSQADKAGGVYEYISRARASEARVSNKTERATTKQVMRDRETLQDYISVAKNQSMVDMLVHLAKVEARLSMNPPGK